MSASDRELLDLAAKAAGLEVWSDVDGNRYSGSPERPWNPLTDDGDALRLASDLQFSVSIDCGYTRVVDQDCRVTFERNHGIAWARRAIVIAAAGVGRAMP